jgi:hypothetical protein
MRVDRPGVVRRARSDLYRSINRDPTSGGAITEFHVVRRAARTFAPEGGVRQTT